MNKNGLDEFVDRGRAAQEAVDRVTDQKVQRRAAIYVRVSTGEQSAAMQLRELEIFCDRRGWRYLLFEDLASGASRKRSGLDALMAEARRRSIDVVVVWRFDRFARSLAQLVGALEEFRELGIDFVSLHEQIDTTTAMGRLIFQISAAFAEFEREIIRERVRGGLRNARARGKQLGRPPSLSDDQLRLLRSLRYEQDLSWSSIQKKMKIPIRTLRRALKRSPAAVAPNTGKPWRNDFRYFCHGVSGGVLEAVLEKSEQAAPRRLWWARLAMDSPRYRTWRGILGGDDVPLSHPGSGRADLGPEKDIEVYLLDLEKFDVDQFGRLVDFIHSTFGSPRHEIIAELRKVGFPIRAADCYVAFDVRAFL